MTTEPMTPMQPIIRDGDGHQTHKFHYSPIYVGYEMSHDDACRILKLMKMETDVPAPFCNDPVRWRIEAIQFYGSPDSVRCLVEFQPIIRESESSDLVLYDNITGERLAFKSSCGELRWEQLPAVGRLFMRDKIEAYEWMEGRK